MIKTSRRNVLKAATALVAVAFPMPHIRNATAATLELRWLGWEHYNVKQITADFEKDHGVKVSAGFFDGNSEAYNKSRQAVRATSILSWPTASGRDFTANRG
jgi:spermidine/putrescine-binding protein